MAANLDSVLALENLTIAFTSEGRTVNAVRNLSLEVQRGEILAVVGESGSGKSVSFLSVLKLIPEGSVRSGRVLFEGQDLLQLDPHGKTLNNIRGGRIGFVFQEPMTSLNPLLTVGRQITETLDRHQGLDRKAARRRAVELLHSVNIPDPEHQLDAYPDEFSGGMRQRIMIAIAIACSPPLIIADEPTTALDVTVQAQVLELLSGLVRRLGSSMILITHNLGVVARYADRVAVMYAGAIVEHGPTVPVLQAPAHPYTRALLACAPRIGDYTRQQPISGFPPVLTGRQYHCPFQPRCDHFRPDCQSAPEPELQHLGADRTVACYFPLQSSAD